MYLDDDAGNNKQGTGMLAGAAAGALAGSFIPGVGTLIGAGVGATIGGLGGGLIGAGLDKKQFGGPLSQGQPALLVKEDLNYFYLIQQATLNLW